MSAAPNLYHKISVNPGDIVFGRNGEVFATILGSCISICVYAPRLKVGGMNHYMLPKHIPSTDLDPNKFGDVAIGSLLKKFKSLGCTPDELIIKIVGGAEIEKKLKGHSVGAENIKIARELLSRFHLKIQAESVGGALGKKLEFNTHTGEIRVSSVCNEHIPSKRIEEILQAAQLEPQNSIELKNSKKIKVLIVDDSPTVQKMLVMALKKSPEVEVVGVASNTKEADEIRKKNKVDLITLDLHMPGENGVEYLKRTMKSNPIPTLIVTGFNLEDSDYVLQALSEGAVDYMEKPKANELDSFFQELNSKVITISKTKLHRLSPIIETPKSTLEFSHEALENGLIAIGSSTGGTEALRVLMEGMPKKVPPILIVQHIPPVFSKSFAQRLDSLCPFDVREAVHDEVVTSNTVYIAPGGFHMKVHDRVGKLRIQITSDPPLNLFRPSVDYLFNSLLELKSKKLVAAILTGMGGDGAKGLLELKSKRKVHTIGQDEHSCVVYGMPRVAFELGALSQVLPLTSIARDLVKALNVATK